MRKILIALTVTVVISTAPSQAQEFPMLNDDPKADRPLEPAMFDFITQILSGKMAAHMHCKLKTKFIREVRNFSTGPEWVETLTIDYQMDDTYGSPQMSFKIPMTAKYGVQKSSNQWSGLGEDIKIEVNDSYGHWLKVTHDGNKNMVQLILGSDLRTHPCMIR